LVEFNQLEQLIDINQTLTGVAAPSTSGATQSIQSNQSVQPNQAMPLNQSLATAASAGAAASRYL
jgi:hypothetical protein